MIFVGSDDHPGLKRAIIEVVPEPIGKRYVHFLRNALDYLPRKGGDDCLVELRLYDRRNAAEARRDLRLAATMAGKYPNSRGSKKISRKLSPFTGCPEEHHKHLKVPICSNALIRRLSAAPMLFASSPTRKRSALDSGTGSRNPRGLDRSPSLLNMEMLREQRKQLQLLEAA